MYMDRYTADIAWYQNLVVYRQPRSACVCYMSADTTQLNMSGMPDPSIAFTFLVVRLVPNYTAW